MYCKLTFEKKSLWMNFFFKLCTYLWISSFIHSRLPTTDFCRYEWKSFVTIFRVQLRRNCHHVVTYNCKISNIVFCCCCSVAKSYPALCNPMDSSFLSFTISLRLFKFMSTESEMASNHLILCRPLPLLISIFPSIRVFSNEFTLHVKWTKYWTFSISLSNEYSRLMSFRINTDWLVWSPCIPRDSQESSPAPQFENISSLVLSLLYGLTLTSTHDYWKTHNFDYMDLCQWSNISVF